MASIGLHIIGLISLFVYWLFSNPFEEKKLEENFNNAYQPQASGNENQSSSGKPEKNPNLKYEDGDLNNQQISQLFQDSFAEHSKLTTAENIKNLNDNFNGLSRTSVKDVQEMTALVKDAFNVEGSNSQKKVIREMSAGDVFDYNSSIIHDFEKNGDQIVLIFKDKNNFIVKGEPEKYSELDSDIKLRVNLLQKAKENKKFQIILDSTDAILQKMQPDNQ